ncbi:uncharacterized protein OCT59_026009 [Rhizophagus irregularis]|uniref:uncharacterized protein n=1 Tax=Rhizophagus irregularis TaxID=588596 RepID=UPI003329E0FE|nr:hypothetical protein OCT59_026009 [Rhizophagus irregularis]
MSNNTELINNSNECDWIEEAISKKLIKFYEFGQFYNLQEIGSGGFGKVYRADWKDSHKCCALKSFYNLNDATIKAIVREIQHHREVDFYDNAIRFYGVTTFKYANGGALRDYLKENFENLTWNDKFSLCISNWFMQYHAYMHSKNILVHQNTVKLADFGLSKRIEESSNLQSKVFGMITYSDVYSIGILLWEISSGRPPFCNELNDLGLAIEILQGLREISIPDTPEEYIKIYTDCWNIEPDDRPFINKVFDRLKEIIKKENIIIKDFHLFNDNNITQSSNNQQPILDEIESLMSSSNQFENNFDTNAFDLLIPIPSPRKLKSPTFESFQKAADLGNSYGINHLGYCYENGIGIDIDYQKAFKLYQKAADLGNSLAQYNLATMYEYEEGIIKNIDKAIYWYKKSAEQGVQEAQNRLE